MKSKVVRIVSAAASAAFAFYYIILQICSTSVFSFSLIWLFLSVCCGTCSYMIRKGSRSRFHIPAAAVYAAVAVCAACCLFLIPICTPRRAAASFTPRYVILLGGGITRKGTLAPGAMHRVQAAAAYHSLHPDAKIIVTGGQGRFVPCPEAAVLYRELVKSGVPEDMMLQETKARDTIQNLSYSAQVIASDSGLAVKDALNVPIIIVTSGYHLARAERIARRLGYTDTAGIPAKTDAVFILNDYTREILAYIKLDIRILITRKPAELY